MGVLRRAFHGALMKVTHVTSATVLGPQLVVQTLLSPTGLGSTVFLMAMNLAMQFSFISK